MRALVTAAAVAAASLLALGAACGANSSASRVLQTRYDRCIAAAGIDACRDLIPSAIKAP